MGYNGHVSCVQVQVAGGGQKRKLLPFDNTNTIIMHSSWWGGHIFKPCMLGWTSNAKLGLQCTRAKMVCWKSLWIVMETNTCQSVLGPCFLGILVSCRPNVGKHRQTVGLDDLWKLHLLLPRITSHRHREVSWCLFLVQPYRRHCWKTVLCHHNTWNMFSNPTSSNPEWSRSSWSRTWRKEWVTTPKTEEKRKVLLDSPLLASMFVHELPNVYNCIAYKRRA